jgi:hypothetical protein
MPAHRGPIWSRRLWTQSKSDAHPLRSLGSWTRPASSRAVFGCDPTRTSDLPEQDGRDHLWRPIPCGPSTSPLPVGTRGSALISVTRPERQLSTYISLPCPNSSSLLVTARQRTRSGTSMARQRPTQTRRRIQKAERLMLSHGYGRRDLLRSRRHDGRSRWLQRLVRPFWVFDPFTPRLSPCAEFR